MYFSIIMPVYNSEKFMKNSINSVLEQDYKNFELILINDGSTDNSAQIASEYANLDNRVIFLQQDNSGPSTARNLGIQKSRGEYLLFIDSDDEFELGAFKQLHKLLTNDMVDILCFGYKIIKVNNNKDDFACQKTSNNKYVTSVEISSQYLEILNKPYFRSVWNKAYKSSFIKNNKLLMDPELFIGEDLIFNMKVLSSANSYKEIDKLLYKYIIQNDDSIINRYNPTKFDQMLRVHNLRNDMILNKSTSSLEMLKADRHSDYIRLCFSTIMDIFRKECNLRKFRDKIIFIEKIKKSKRYSLNLSDLHYLNLKQKVVYLIFALNNNYIIYFSALLFYIIKFKKRF